MFEYSFQVPKGFPDLIIRQSPQEEKQASNQ